MKKKTVIDLFAGCGGMSLGFEMAGFTPVLAIDNWQDALSTYSYNHNSVPTLCADISLLEPSVIQSQYNLPRIDVVIGGPPCQGFSIAGKRIIEDERNTLYKTFVNFVNVFRPTAFVMENVPNILSIGGGIIKEAILADFQKIGYQVYYQNLIASDYGVPQNRKRAIFVGIRNGEFHFPIVLAEPPISSKDAISDLPENSVDDGENYSTTPQSEFQKQMRTISQGIYNHQITIHNDKTKEIIAMVPDGGNYKDLPQHLRGTRKVNIAWTRLNSQKPSFTIDTGHNHHFHYIYNRVPTARESARLQSFPDCFIFTGGKTSQLKQIGNAVPPLLAKELAQQLIRSI